MTPEGYNARRFAVEDWANRELVKYLPAVDADPRPGCGEPGHVYNEVKALAYSQRFAPQRAFIESAVEYIHETIDAAFYGVEIPEAPNAGLRHLLDYFERLFAADAAYA